MLLSFQQEERTQVILFISAHLTQLWASPARTYIKNRTKQKCWICSVQTESQAVLHSFYIGSVIVTQFVGLDKSLRGDSSLYNKTTSLLSYAEIRNQMMLTLLMSVSCVDDKIYTSDQG